MAFAKIMSLISLLVPLVLAAGGTPTPYGGGATSESGVAATTVTETVTVSLTECASASYVPKTTIQRTTTVFSTVTYSVSKTMVPTSSVVETSAVNATGLIPPQSASSTLLITPSVNPSGGYTYPATSSSISTSTSSSSFGTGYGSGYGTGVPSATMTSSCDTSSGHTAPYPTGTGTITEALMPTGPSASSLKGTSSVDGAHTTASIVPANSSVMIRGGVDTQMLFGTLALVTLMVAGLF